jgi:hypothetical protein
MKEIIRANDPALLSFVEALLTEAGIVYFGADAHISVIEGTISAFQRRVLVAAGDEDAARQLLADADLGVVLKMKK